MWIALIVVIVVVVGAVLAKLMWRSNGDEVHSVRSYQSALETMEDLSHRNVRPAIRVVEPPVEPGGSIGLGAPGQVPPVSLRGSDEWTDPEAPLVFDDGRTRDRYGRAPVDEVAPAFRSDRARKHAIQSMNHRPRRLVTTAVVAVVVVVFVVLALVGSHHSVHSAGGHTTSSTATTGTAGSSHHVTTPTTAAAHTHSTSATHSTGTTTKGSKGSKGSKGRSTTTTLPPSQIVSSSSSATGVSAVYPVGSNSYQVTIAATGECWVDATTLSSGSTLWTGTLQAGGSQVVQATGAISVELGAPGATLAVGDVPVVFPTPFHTPFTASFEPAVASSGGAGSSSTTTPSTTTSTTTPTTP